MASGHRARPMGRQFGRGSTVGARGGGGVLGGEAHSRSMSARLCACDRRSAHDALRLQLRSDGTRRHAGLVAGRAVAVASRLAGSLASGLVAVDRAHVLEYARYPARADDPAADVLGSLQVAADGSPEAPVQVRSPAWFNPLRALKPLLLRLLRCWNGGEAGHFGGVPASCRRPAVARPMCSQQPLTKARKRPDPTDWRPVSCLPILRHNTPLLYEPVDPPRVAGFV